MSTATSIGPGPERGGNEDHGNADGMGNKTLGDHDMPEPEAGGEFPGEAAPDLPGVVPGSPPKPGIAKGAQQSFAEGPDVEAGSQELDAARGKLPSGGPRRG